MNKNGAISLNKLKDMEKAYLNDEKSRVLRRALDQNDPLKISYVFEENQNIQQKFSIDIPTMEVCDQMHSGRCWLFASCNVMREIIGKKLHIKQFELSQNYLAFYDKLEKCNFYLESVINEIEAPYNSENLRYIMSVAIGDGGQWDMLTSLVKKYGIAPKYAMRETFTSSNTSFMNELLNKRLRKFTAESKRAYKKDKKLVSELKEDCLFDCYKIIADCYGLPPHSFTLEYVDDKNKYHAIENVTPLDLYKKYLGENLDDYIGIINGPTEDKPYYKTFTVKYLGNVIDGDEVSMLNLPIDDFKKAILNQMKDKKPVWFGCDCSKDRNREKGIWDDKLFDYNDTFSVNFDMSKEDMLNTRHSAMNHAMVLTGVNLVKNKPTKWKIENSWGDKVAEKGYYVASDSWFDKYVYQAVVHKKYLSDKAIKALKTKPIVLDPWDPFGTLA